MILPIILVEICSMYTFLKKKTYLKYNTLTLIHNKHCVLSILVKYSSHDF